MAPITPTPAEVKAGDWEEDFFKKHNVTDDKEKAAIRGRARVLAYRDAQRKHEETEEKSTKPNEKAWYQE